MGQKIFPEKRGQATRKCESLGKKRVFFLNKVPGRDKENRRTGGGSGKIVLGNRGGYGKKKKKQYVYKGQSRKLQKGRVK